MPKGGSLEPLFVCLDTYPPRTLFQENTRPLAPEAEDSTDQDHGTLNRSVSVV